MSIQDGSEAYALEFQNRLGRFDIVGASALSDRPSERSSFDLTLIIVYGDAVD